MESAKVFGQGAKVGESDKLNIDSIIARLLEGKIATITKGSAGSDFLHRPSHPSVSRHR